METHLSGQAACSLFRRPVPRVRRQRSRCVALQAINSSDIFNIRRENTYPLLETYIRQLRLVCCSYLLSLHEGGSKGDPKRDRTELSAIQLPSTYDVVSAKVAYIPVRQSHQDDRIDRVPLLTCSIDTTSMIPSESLPVDDSALNRGNKLRIPIVAKERRVICALRRTLAHPRCSYTSSYPWRTNSANSHRTKEPMILATRRGERTVPVKPNPTDRCERCRRS